jgi:hypothetical protein
MTKKANDYRPSINSGYNAVEALQNYSATALKNRHMSVTIVDCLVKLNEELKELDNALKVAYERAA